MDLDGYLSSRYIETDEWLDFEQQLVPRGYRLATWGETGLHSLYSRIDPEEVYVDDTGVSAVFLSECLTCDHDRLRSSFPLRASTVLGSRTGLMFGSKPFSAATQRPSCGSTTFLHAIEIILSTIPFVRLSVEPH